MRSALGTASQAQPFLASPPSFGKLGGVKRDVKASVEWVSHATHPSLLEEYKPALTKKILSYYRGIVFRCPALLTEQQC